MPGQRNVLVQFTGGLELPAGRIFKMSRTKEFIKRQEARILIYLVNAEHILKYGRYISWTLRIDYIYTMKLLSFMFTKGWVKTHKYEGRTFFNVTIKSPIKEAKERRNLLVHNNGIVNRRYLYKFKGEKYHPNTKSLKEGDALHVSRGYFDRTLDEIMISGIIFGQECWRKWHPKDVEIADNELIETIYNLLVEKKWELARRLSHYGRTSKVSNEAKQLIYEFNYCLTLKSLQKSKEFKTELNKIDVSSLKPYLLLGYYALKNDLSNFYSSLRNTLGAVELDKELLLEWPIAQELKKEMDALTEQELADFKESRRRAKAKQRGIR